MPEQRQDIKAKVGRRHAHEVSVVHPRDQTNDGKVAILVLRLPVSRRVRCGPEHEESCGRRHRLLSYSSGTRTSEARPPERISRTLTDVWSVFDAFSVFAVWFADRGDEPRRRGAARSIAWSERGFCPTR